MYSFLKNRSFLDSNESEVRLIFNFSDLIWKFSKLNLNYKKI